MKVKPIVAYLLIWITCGFYGIYWAYKVMNYINTTKNEKIYNFKKIVLFVIIFFAIDIPLFLSINESCPILFLIVFVLHIIWLILVFKYVYSFSFHIHNIQKENSIDHYISPKKTILLMFLYFTAIPYIQHHLNKLLTKETYNS